MRINTLEDKTKLQMKMEYNRFKNKLKQQLEKFDIEKDFSDTVFLCIGTNKLIGDMIGPMVGERLRGELGKYNNKIGIYGNMYETFNLKNANKIIKNIKEKHPKPFIITIDTALSKENITNKIVVTNGNIEIGKAIGKGMEIDSHINIKGIVGIYNDVLKKNIETLKNVRIESVVYISTIITKGIIETIKIVTK